MPEKTKTKTNYRVIWFVTGARFSDLFDAFALADSFRSDLVAASRRVVERRSTGQRACRCRSSGRTTVGHSVAVLRRIYAKVIACLESAAYDRIEKALDWLGYTSP